LQKFTAVGLNRKVARRLVDDYNIAIRSMKYWPMAEDFFSLNRPIRVSFVHYDTLDDVRFFLDEVSTICKRHRAAYHQHLQDSREFRQGPGCGQAVVEYDEGMVKKKIGLVYNLRESASSADNLFFRRLRRKTQIMV